MRKSVSISFFALAVAFTSVSTFAKEGGTRWCHAGFTAEGGTQVQLDYQVGFNNGIYYADPLWINVSRPEGFSGNEKVRAVLVPQLYYTYTGEYIGESSPLTVDLYFDSNQGKFTTEASGLRILGRESDGYKSQTGFRHQVAVVIDDNWLKVSGTGQSNFSMNLYRSHSEQGYCYNAYAPL